MTPRVLVVAVLVAFGLIAATAVISIRLTRPAKPVVLTQDELAESFRQLRVDLHGLERQLNRPDSRLVEEPSPGGPEMMTGTPGEAASAGELSAQVQRLRREMLAVIQNEARRRHGPAPEIVSTVETVLSAPGESFALAFPPGTRAERATIENVGSSILRKPQLVLDGTLPGLNVDAILETQLAGAQSEEKKAVALWKFVERARVHDWPAHREKSDPVKLTAVYGYGFCNHAARSLAILAQAAGLEARTRDYPGEHVVCEILVDGRWVLFDPDGGVFYRNADGRIATVDELRASPDLIRAHPSPIYPEEKLVRLYQRDDVKLRTDFSKESGYQIAFDLRPGESITYLRHPTGHFFASRHLEIPLEYANGIWRFAPQWQHGIIGAAAATNLRRAAGGAMLEKIDPASPAELVYVFEPGYPILDGTIRAGANDRIAISRDGSTWTPLATGEPLARFLANAGGNPDYKLFVRVEPGGPELKPFEVSLNFQTARRALPLPEGGANGRLDFGADGPSSARVAFALADSRPGQR
ncbi:MAG: transglutaminase domain-containing protein [Terrimicrobiaceae bacterium]|nr:transglutaminase domain-containing protein [Terrimicrobiaceae bacterium]